MDDLKQKAGEQSRQLADKQAEADAALREITVSMQVIFLFFFTKNSFRSGKPSEITRISK